MWLLTEITTKMTVLKWIEMSVLKLVLYFCPQILNMGECISIRVLLMFLALISYLIALTFNILALFGPWTGEFLKSTSSQWHLFEIYFLFFLHPTECFVTCVFEHVGAFMQTTQYVLSKSTTHLTPDRWVLFLWDVLNVWLIGMFIYLIHNLRRR